PRRTRASSSVGLAALLAFVAGCGAETAPGASAPLADSAGIPVVLNATQPDGVATWRLSAEPRLEIGVADGPPEQMLFQAFDGAVLSDGTVVIANAGTFELRFYDA